MWPVSLRVSLVIRVTLAAVCGLAVAPLFSVAAAARQGAPPSQLVVAVRVVDKQGGPLTDLKPDEFEVRENGTPRPIVRAELDTRPLTSALIVDSGAAIGAEYQLTIVPSAVALVRALPSGTTVDLWTTGDRATRVSAGITDPAAAEAALRNTAPSGGNALLDALVEASRALGQPADRRAAVFVLTSAAQGGGAGREIEAAMRQTSMVPSFYSLEMAIGQQDPRIQTALEYVAAHTAGYFEKVLSTGGLSNHVPVIVQLANSQYRIAWQPGSDPRSTKFDFEVKRKGAKLVSAQRLSTTW